MGYFDLPIFLSQVPVWNVAIFLLDESEDCVFLVFNYVRDSWLQSVEMHFTLFNIFSHSYRDPQHP